MNNHILPIIIAFIIFPAASVFLTTPYLVIQYRKYAYINKYKAFVFFSFILYFLCAYFLVILPLPESRDIISLYGANRTMYNLIPFQWIFDIARETSVSILHPSSYLHILKENAFQQVVFNIVLTIPLGIYLRYYFERKLKQVILISLLVSLFFELSQLTGLFFLYNAPYRLFDVDDLFLNTVGGLIGYAITPFVSFLLPKINSLNSKKSASNNTVSLFRRLTAASVDWIIIFAIIKILNMFKIYPNKILLYTLSIFLYFVVQVYITNGLTIGKRLVKIRLRRTNNKLNFYVVLCRYILLYSIPIGMNILFAYVSNFMLNNPIALFSIISIHLLFNMIIFVDIITNIKSKQFFYDRVLQCWHVQL